MKSNFADKIPGGDYKRVGALICVPFGIKRQGRYSLNSYYPVANEVFSLIGSPEGDDVAYFNIVGGSGFSDYDVPGIQPGCHACGAESVYPPA